MISQKNRIIFIGIVLCVLVSACSSPESDGKKAAKKWCDCSIEYAGKMNKVYETYIENFDSYSFKTRIAAREEINKRIQEVENELNKCREKATTYHNKLNDKYLTNREKAAKYQYAYIAQNNSFTAPVVDVNTFSSAISNLIQTIIPPKPDLEKLKRDLIGRKITEQPNGYHRQGWYWEIESPNELKEVKIVNATENGADYILDVYLLLQGEANQHEANVRITYILGQYNDWTIEFLETQEINIVKTGKYNNCIISQRKGWSSEYYLEFTNQCDVSLVVGGAILSEYGGEWKKFSTIVDANGTKSVGGLFSISVRDYQIHFIERP